MEIIFKIKEKQRFENAHKKIKYILSEAFLMNFVTNYQNNFFTEHLHLAASVLLKQ